jgi:hypothetical protein
MKTEQRNGDIRKEFQQFRGCFIILAAILVLAVGGGIGTLLKPILGKYSLLAGLAGIILCVLVWIGIAKGAKWAEVIIEVILLMAGAGVSLSIMIDFATSLASGHGLLSGSGGGANGQAVLIIFAAGIALMAGGLHLIGWLKRK